MFFLVALVFLYACGPQERVVKLQPANQFAEKKEIQQKEIVVKEGTFVLTNLSLVTQYGSELKGDVINNTSKDWREVIFEVEFYDQSGKKITESSGENPTFSIYFIKQGETKRIGSIGLGYKEYIWSGKVISTSSSAAISSYDIRFKSGELPAKYILVMTKPKQSQELTFEDSFISIQFF